MDDYDSSPTLTCMENEKTFPENKKEDFQRDNYETKTEDKLKQWKQVPLMSNFCSISGDLKKINKYFKGNYNL